MSRTLRRLLICVVGAALAFTTVPSAAAQDDDTTTTSAPESRLTVDITDLPGSEWRSLSPIRSTVEGREAGGTTEDSESIDPDAATEAERSIAELGGRRTPDGLVLTLPETVLFDFDSADLVAASDDTIDRVAELLAFYADVEVEVQGHSDSKGEADYNLTLSQERADAVRNALVDAGISAGRLEAEGFGETQPRAPNTTESGDDDPAGREQNRRVDIVVRES